MRPNSIQDASPPKNRPGAPSVGFNNKRLRRLFRAVCANVSWKDIPTVMEEDGFTPKLSTCREYFKKFTNISPGKVSHLEDKDAQRGRIIQMLDRVKRRQATGTPPIPPEAPESFKGVKTRPDIIGSVKEDTQDTIQDQTWRRFKMAKASRSPDNRESIMINKDDSNATFKSSGKKRPNPSYYDIEGVDIFPHKKPDGGRSLHSLGSIPTSLVPGPGLDQSRSDEVGDGPTLNTAHSHSQRTVQDVERDMNLPPGSSDFWRLTWGSSIYGSSRPSTISLVLDEQLPNFGQDDTSGQLSSSIALLFQLFENSRPDAQIKSDLRTLLQHAGDVAARILVNARNNSRKLPLEFTIERGLYGTCRELLDFGADVSKRSSTGKSLPKLARRIQRRTAEDMPEYYAVGICHQLLMDYSTAPNAKTIERRKKLGSIAKRDKRDSLASIKESFTYPPPSAPLPPVSHRHFSWESSRAATTQLNLPENCSFDPPPNYRPPIERQRNGVSQLVNHFDALGSNKGYSSLSLEAEIYRQPGDEDNVRVSPRTRPPAHNFESYMMSGALDDSAATHYPHGSSADNLVHPLQTGKYLELDGQVVIAFPVQAQVSDLQRLNSFSQFLYPSRAAHSWILGPPFDPLNMEMATFQATGQEDSLPPYPQIPVTNGRNDIIYENQGYNRQGDIALQEQQQQGPFQPSAGDATPNFPADGTFSYSGYLSSSPAPIQNEMEEFNFGFKFDNLENNETAQYC